MIPLFTVALVLFSSRLRFQRTFAVLLISLMPLTASVPLCAQTGTTPGTASFQGNFTAVSTTSEVLGLARETNCSLTLLTGNYSLSSGLTYTRTGLTSNYDRVLHTEAGLTTTPGVYSGGCTSLATGIGSRTGFFLGPTTTGLNVFAGISYNPVTMGNALNIMVGTDATTYTISTFSFMSAFVLTAADLNGDGNSDLVVANDTGTTSGSVSVMMGNANGTFNTAVTYPTAGTGTVAVVIDDFNNDGKLDIVAISNDQQISVLLGNGDGTFQAAQTFAAPALPGYTSSASTPIVNIISADVNNDGNKDLIGSNGLVLLGNGNGTFTATSAPAFPYPTANNAFGPNLASGDINKDGKLDLVVGIGDTVLTYLGNGNGTFTPGNSYASINSVGYVTVSDLDGDGNPDIYVGMANGGAYEGDQYENNESYALMGNGDGTFQGAPRLAPGTSQVNSIVYNGTNLGDVNDDGVPDLIVPASGGGFTVELSTGKGSFSPASTVTAPASFTATTSGLTSPVTIVNANTAVATSYAVADINNDGKADIVFVDNGLTALNPNNGNSPITYPAPILFVALSNGDGTFQTPVPYSFPQLAPSGDFDTNLSVTNLQLADINNDGKTDLIFTYNDQEGATFGGPAVNPYEQGIGVLLGNGNGAFSTTPILTSTYSSSTPSSTGLLPQVTNIADLNNDSKLDLVTNYPTFSIATGAVTQLQVFLGNGDGTFQAPKTLALNANVYGIPVLADFNKDGKLDLAIAAEVASTSQAELVTALGNGDGTFATPTILDLAGGDTAQGASLASADFNADGYLDLALLDNNAFSGVFYGTGTGSFTSVAGTGYVLPKDLINIEAFGAAIAVDLNKDGKPDILAGGTSLLSTYGSAPATTTTATALTATVTTITAGASITFTATVTPHGGSPTPTGTVSFLNGATQLGTGTVNAAGVATYVTTSLPVGALSITASYGGDTNFSASTSTALPVTVNAAALVGTTSTLTSTATSAVSGTSITFTATVTPASGTAVPTGMVAFFDSTLQIGTGTLNASGVATYTTSTLGLGGHNITTVYNGATGVFSGSVSNVVAVTISAPAGGTKVALNISITAPSVGAVATMNAVVTPLVGTGIPTGTVTFVNNGTVTLGTITLDATGTAVLMTANLVAGTSADTVTVTYSGSTTYTASATSSGAFTYVPASAPGFVFGISPATTTVIHGSTAGATLTFIPTDGFAGATSITCTGTPANSLFSALPASITPVGGNPGTTTLSLATSVTTGSLVRPQPFSLAALPLGILAGLALFGFPRKRLPAVRMFALALVACLLAATGCGGKGNSGGSQSTLTTAPGTYNLSIVGTSGTTTNSIPWTVIVQ